MAYYDDYTRKPFDELSKKVLNEVLLNKRNSKPKSSESMVTYTINEARRDFKPGDYLLITQSGYKPSYAKLIAINTGSQHVVVDRIKSDVIFTVQWITKNGRFDDSYDNIEYVNATFNKATKEEIYLKCEEYLHNCIGESKKKIDAEQSKIRSYKEDLQALKRLYK